jgi:hypothetical protein
MSVGSYDTHLLGLDVSHPIQTTILDRLRHTEWLEYTELLPDGLSGNEFLYHLKKLENAGLISKHDKRYTLSEMGLLLADAASYQSNKLKLRPTTGMFLHVTTASGMVLLYRSMRAPFFGKLCLPFGKLRLGQTYEETLMRMVQKRGLLMEDLRDVNYKIVNIRYKWNGKLTAHRCGVLVEAKYVSQAADGTSTINGSSYFAPPDTEFLEKSLLDNTVQDVSVDIN